MNRRLIVLSLLVLAMLLLAACGGAAAPAAPAAGGEEAAAEVVAPPAQDEAVAEVAGEVPRNRTMVVAHMGAFGPPEMWSPWAVWRYLATGRRLLP